MRNFLCLVLALLACNTQAFDLQGHRGARGLAPENTLPAFATALTLGVTTLEMDVGITRDGVVVVHHDRRLNADIARGPGGRWIEKPGPLVHELTFEELRRYDVGRLRPGSEYGKPLSGQRPADGARIPKLADVFALVAKSGNQEVRFNIETKTSAQSPADTLPPAEFARALIAEIRKAGVAKRSTIQSFDWRTLKAVQEQAPGIGTVYLTGGNLAADALERIRDSGGVAWSPSFRTLNAGMLKAARALGFKVVVWTVNKPEDIRRMLDAGVDGIISDRPDLVRTEMGRRGILLPMQTPVSPRRP